MLWCQRCKAFTRHEHYQSVTPFTNVATSGLRCTQCKQPETSHEAPADDAPALASAGFTRRERLRLEFVRWLIATGRIHEGV